MAAPNIEQALISFAKLVALLEGDTGALRWQWFADPGDETLGSIHNRRAHLRDLLRALIDPSRLNTPDRTIDAVGYAWEPISITSGVGVGVAWNTTGDSLDLALAADAEFTEILTLAVLAKLFHIKNGSLGGDFGNIKFGGTFPVPDFLKSGTLDGTITLTPAAQPPQITLGVTDKSAPARSRAITVPTGSPTEVFAWDCARVAIFVVEAWIKQQAQNNAGPFFSRVSEHLLPMFGAPPPQPIGVFPLFQPTGEAADFEPWMDSVLTLGGGAPGALTFLWHARALVTGNESGDFIQGSLYFPLVSGPDLGSQPPSFNSVGSTPPPASTPGAWFVIKNPDGQPTVTRLLLELHANNTVWRAPLADANGTTLSRPNVSAQDWVAAPPPSTIDLGDGKALTLSPESGGFVITLVGENLAGPVPLGGQYTASVVVKPNQPVTFRAQLGGLPLVLPPPTNTKDAFGLVAQWLLKTAASVPGNTFPGVTNALAELVKTAVVGTPDPGALVLALADVMAESQVAGDKATITAGPLSIGLAAGNPPSIEGALTFEKIVLDQLKDVELRIGKLTAKTGFNLKTGALSSVSLGITDLRLVSPAGTGLIASIMPDLTELKGFDLKVAWGPGGVQVAGGAKIPIQQALGPLNISGLLVRIDAPKELAVGVDLSLSLGPVLVSAYELGVIVPFSATAPTPFLHGLALSMDTDVVRLAGLFGKVDEDYVGGLVVKVASLFELSAIGGYTQLPSGDTSLFMFASLVAPLGGTPYFFLTGIAGGFGYNRTLPPSGLLANHPFLQIMSGAPLPSDIGAALVKLSDYFDAKKGVHWLAAGIQFNSFGFINGKLVAAVSVGNAFSIQILGMASFGIAPIAYFELAFETSVDEEKFLLKAGLTPNSYVIHPDIFSLRGEFGLGVWHSGDHSGDFILSIGGYHPYFQVPEHYPTLERVGVKATVFGFVKVSVEVFFACTPQAIMAGAAISLSAEFGDIGAGLDVYIDVLITWDPFSLWARMGVTVWFQFLGRHEIGVELEIWTPPFGGLAVIDLALVSFEVEFGDDRNGLPPPPIHEFLEQQLSVPADPVTIDGKPEAGARVAAFSTPTKAGLFKVDLLEGRASKDESKKKSSEQEGLDTPIPVKPEFAFSVRSRLPLAVSGDAHAQMTGEIDLPLCEKNDNQSTLTVGATKINDPNVEVLPLDDWFPAAQFGDALEVTQADGARQNVSNLKSDEPRVPRREGAIFRYVAPLVPAALKDVPLNAKTTEATDNADLYPLPLGASGSFTLRTTKSVLAYAVMTSATTIKPRPKVENRRASASRALQTRTVAPVRVVTRSADFDRAPVVTRLRGQTLAAVPAGVATIAVPASPVRAAELYAVTLRLVGARTAAPVARIVPSFSATRVTTKPQAFVMQPIAAPVTPVGRPAVTIAAAALPTPSKGPVTVNAGKAVHLEVSSGRVRRGSLTSTTGRQVVRAVVLDAFDHPLNDVYIGAGERAMLPVGTRGVVLIGEGAAAPVSSGASPVAQENIGVEHDTALLALGPRVFAGHGCVVQSMTALRIAPDRLETVPGYEVLRTLSNARIHFPAAGAPATLVVTVAPNGSDAPPAMDEVRWAAVGATIGNLQTVVSASGTAFVMSLRAGARWRLDVDLGRGWRLTAAVVCTTPPAAIVDQLRSAQAWEFVDDRFETQRLAATATIDVEIAS